MTLTRILCPVDLSEPSAHALAQAGVVSHWYRSRITALYVHEPIAANVPDDAREIQRLREEVRSFACAAVASEKDVDVVVDVGQPVREILARANDLGIDLIVMGTHGTSGFEHLLLGSVTEKVLRKARCPVLTVPPRAHRTSRLPFARILCPIDFSSSSLSALEWAWSLAEESQAAITLLHVVEWPWAEPPAPQFDTLPAHEAEKLREFRRLLETTSRARLDALVPENVRNTCRAACLISHGKTHRQVLQAAGDVQADLIVMGVHGRDAVDLTLFGSTTNEVVRRASCPVLTVRAAR
jgi:nucleotide-binding universal stress UspA family protein